MKTRVEEMQDAATKYITDYGIKCMIEEIKSLKKENELLKSKQSDSFIYELYKKNNKLEKENAELKHYKQLIEYSNLNNIRQNNISEYNKLQWQLINNNCFTVSSR
ncbi:hypothetical protein [Klebsiella pneumoniae]|nr:hypothetical protein [Klebsiella pneumoniae]